MTKDLFQLPDDLPVPTDDGAARHLWNSRLPEIELVATDGTWVNLGRLSGTLVLFCYPRTGRPGELSLVEDWDQIPGARGCTTQVCGFRDLYSELRQAGVQHLFGLSTQTPEYQRIALPGKWPPSLCRVMPGRTSLVSPAQNSKLGSGSTTHFLSAECTNTGQLNICPQAAIAQ